MTGIRSRRSRGRLRYLPLAVDAGTRKMERAGWMRKMAGRTAMVTTMDRLRR
jgi:hypothetical protein